MIELVSNLKHKNYINNDFHTDAEMVLRFPNASQKACRCNNETTLPAKVPPTPVTESNDYVSDDVKKKEQNRKLSTDFSSEVLQYNS